MNDPLDVVCVGRVMVDCIFAGLSEPPRMGEEVFGQHFGTDDPVAGLIQALKVHEELVVEAALAGSRTLALKAFLASPLLHSGEVAERLLDEMLAANRDHLPQFNGEVRL